MTITSAVSAARTILTRLHDVMASRSHAQAKLNTVVEVIGAGLDSEVCSVYLLREGMLELFATRGLAQEAVHVTRMAVGEGLVGTIAQNTEMLNLAEATRRQGMQGKALHYYREALELDPDNQFAIAGEGMALVEKGAVEKARKNLVRIEQLCGNKTCAPAKQLAAAISRGPAPQVVTAAQVEAKPEVSAN